MSKVFNLLLDTGIATHNFFFPLQSDPGRQDLGSLSRPVEKLSVTAAEQWPRVVSPNGWKPNALQRFESATSIKSASWSTISRRPARNSSGFLGSEFKSHPSWDFDFTFGQNHRPDWNKSFGCTPLHVPNNMTRWAIPAGPRHQASHVMDRHACHTIVRIRQLHISNLKVHVMLTLQDEEAWICRQWFVLTAQSLGQPSKT